MNLTEKILTNIKKNSDLSEKDDISEISAIFRRNCKPCLSEIRKGKHRCRDQSGPECDESRCMCLSPNEEDTFLEQVGEWSGENSIILDEFTVISS